MTAADASNTPDADADAGGPPAEPPSPTGILVIDKPLGLTSTAVCNAIKARLRRAGAPKRVKVGHAGTLDPMATGVLVVLIGRAATRLADSLMAGRKGYIAQIDLAHTSISDDTEREPQPVEVATPPSRADIEAALPRFVGTIMQRPPDHSAILVDGRRAYKIARKGRDPGLPERPVLVHSIDLLDYAWPRLTLDIACGKGTYIRSLARDLGTALGTGGMLAALRRTQVGPFTIGQARCLGEVPDPLSQADLEAIPTALAPTTPSRNEQAGPAEAGPAEGGS